MVNVFEHFGLDMVLETDVPGKSLCINIHAEVNKDPGVKVIRGVLSVNEVARCVSGPVIVVGIGVELKLAFLSNDKREDSVTHLGVVVDFVLGRVVDGEAENHSSLSGLRLIVVELISLESEPASDAVFPGAREVLLEILDTGRGSKSGIEKGLRGEQVNDGLAVVIVFGTCVVVVAGEVDLCVEEVFDLLFVSVELKLEASVEEQPVYGAESERRSRQELERGEGKVLDGSQLVNFPSVGLCEVQTDNGFVFNRGVGNH